MRSSTTIAALSLLVLASAKTDLSGCTSTATTDAYAQASVLWYVPSDGEVCEILDCGGGRAPPKTDVPGCAAYEGTASYTPTYLPGFGASATPSASALPSAVASETSVAVSQWSSWSSSYAAASSASSASSVAALPATSAAPSTLITSAPAVPSVSSSTVAPVVPSASSSAAASVGTISPVASGSGNSTISPAGSATPAPFTGAAAAINVRSVAGLAVGALAVALML
ncbi:hypothetical protein LTS18_001380 [Coniosporium uncinatum]|uniref:Uncharacterized protein n=1 Tax=Coniosporium uncinatum TaxID=93489 RepID=A0ACC3DF50_9PEZI|nr:hypothetical protein LTS18_001380 [Coniosporium uncinatum]